MPLYVNDSYFLAKSRLILLKADAEQSQETSLAVVSDTDAIVTDGQLHNTCIS